MGSQYLCLVLETVKKKNMMNYIYRDTELVNEVDVLPVEELSTTLFLLRRLTAESLRAASTVLEKLANSLDVVEKKADLVEISSEVEDKGYNLLSPVNDEVLTRQRKDTLDSTDSGLEEDCSFSSEIDQDSGLELISLEEVSYHCTVEDGWMVIYDKVYDVTEYLESDMHPGGADVMMEYLGYDATMAFRGVGHSKGALRTLEKFLIGILPTQERLNLTTF